MATMLELIANAEEGTGYGGKKERLCLAATITREVKAMAEGDCYESWEEAQRAYDKLTKFVAVENSAKEGRTRCGDAKFWLELKADEG